MIMFGSFDAELNCTCGIMLHIRELVTYLCQGHAQLPVTSWWKPYAVSITDSRHRLAGSRSATVGAGTDAFDTVFKIHPSLQTSQWKDNLYCWAQPSRDRYITNTTAWFWLFRQSWPQNYESWHVSVSRPSCQWHWQLCCGFCNNANYWRVSSWVSGVRHASLLQCTSFVSVQVVL